MHTISSPATSTAPTSSSLTTLFSLKSHVSHVVRDSQSFVMNVSHNCEPNSFEEASMDPAWQRAMTQEFTALHDNNTWTLTTLPIDKKAIGCRWIYKVKYKAYGSIERYMLDYIETFSSVVKMMTVWALIATAAKKQWDIYQLDVDNAFCHGNLHEEVYINVPQGLVNPHKNVVCRINKSLYDLKQASRQWYEKLTATLHTRGYVHSFHDYSLFCRKRGTSTIFLGVYVDDMLLKGKKHC